MTQIVKKIEAAGLVGRGGAGFPTARKWTAVKQARADQKYVICNASEGEPGVFKDHYILMTHPEMVFQGLKLAIDYLGKAKGVLYINSKSYQSLKTKLTPLLKKYKVELIIEEPSYIGGEETALLNYIEGKRLEPRLKPPYPSDAGLYNKPTIINNVETLYNVALVDAGQYNNERFYSITVSGRRKGVYSLPEDLSIAKILEASKSLPDYKFFVQIGGGAAGPVYNQKQITRQKVSGAGSIEVYKADMKPIDLLNRWFKFYDLESCGKCSPCRMGSYNLVQLVKGRKTVPWKEVLEIVETMEKTSFCALGSSIATPIKTYLKNVLKIK